MYKGYAVMAHWSATLKFPKVFNIVTHPLYRWQSLNRDFNRITDNATLRHQTVTVGQHICTFGQPYGDKVKQLL